MPGPLAAGDRVAAGAAARVSGVRPRGVPAAAGRGRGPGQQGGAQRQAELETNLREVESCIITAYPTTLLGPSPS